MSNKEELQIYRVVVNHELQYSIWPLRMEPPLGWRDEGMRGSKADCLAHIDRVWHDMLPLSLRSTPIEPAADTESAPVGRVI